MKHPVNKGAPKFALWALGIGIVLMLGSFALMPFLPDAPLGVQWAGVFIGMGLFTVGLRVIAISVATDARKENGQRRQKGPRPRHPPN